ncbi:hypothetical protein [Thermanaeromonas toyohensis]|uniref:hypothetical protein n=1 Tax=Thermanaeromonas toyohensis TaxID=161154 RepID=UPI0009FE7A26|nr:hypothetical protein [Thermanaeromonas toyohensis]
MGWKHPWDQRGSALPPWSCWAEKGVSLAGSHRYRAIKGSWPEGAWTKLFWLPKKGGTTGWTPVPLGRESFNFWMAGLFTGSVAKGEDEDAHKIP